MNSLCCKKLLSISTTQNVDLIQYLSFKRNFIVITNLFIDKNSSKSKIYLSLDLQYVILNFTLYYSDFNSKKTLKINQINNLFPNFKSKIPTPLTFYDNLISI